MTNQHPLTDEMLQELAEEPLDGLVGGNFVKEYMCAAADWQLEQVIKYLEDDLLFVLWSNHYTVRTYMDKFKKAMRPLHPVREEDN